MDTLAPAHPSEASSVAPSLTRQVHERLRADLLGGHWQPGGKLPMHLLRARYDVGASPLRESLGRLATEGLVVHHDQRGFCAAAVSAAELRDVVDTRVALESMALAQAFARRTPQWEEALVLAFHRLSRTPRSVQVDSYEENPQWEVYHRAFHRALLSACGSPVLLGFCDQLYDRAYRYRQLAARKAYKRRNEQDEHQAIFDAVMAMDLPTAQRLLAGHYERTAALFTGTLGKG
ncbi:FCD domain-containing protein [uncultured Xylophilus sp.]|uniref:GntR family transcriptional regulator n=1 Tax=uncultured Xylophilus sp. TaxID=296832 RepID=UPI0025FAE923|nr:FCD domain-containing protein [uncultured Xylophilus sp.]